LSFHFYLDNFFEWLPLGWILATKLGNQILSKRFKLLCKPWLWVIKF
jgi:hypothetical protein